MKLFVDKKTEEKKENVMLKIFGEKRLPEQSYSANQKAINRCIFIPADSFKNSNEDKNQVMGKANNYVEELLKMFYKIMNNISVQKDCQSQFYMIFVKLFIYSKLLLQEVKELEYLKDYLVSKYEEAKDKITKSDALIQQYGAALEGERKVRAAITEKYQEMEKRMIMINSGQALKENQVIKELQNQIYQLEADLDTVHGENENMENKIKILIKEIKSLRARTKELEDNTGLFYDDFVDLKNIFDNLNVVL